MNKTDRDFFRQRMNAAVDKFFAELDSHSDTPDDLSVDTFVIAMVGNYTDASDHPREVPLVYAESNRHYVKIGVLDMCLQGVKDSYGWDLDDSEDEDEADPE